jgi:hypothetical protein
LNTVFRAGSVGRAVAELRAKELQLKLETAESNLREVSRNASLAKGTAGVIEDPEAAAVLRFLQSSEAPGPSPD